MGHWKGRTLRETSGGNGMTKEMASPENVREQRSNGRTLRNFTGARRGGEIEILHVAVEAALLRRGMPQRLRESSAEKASIRRCYSAIYIEKGISKLIEALQRKVESEEGNF